MPVEGIDALALVSVDGVEERLVALAVEAGEVRADEAIAAADVVVEGAERFARGGGVQPEGEFGDFHGFRVESTP